MNEEALICSLQIFYEYCRSENYIEENLSINKLTSGLFVVEVTAKKKWLYSFNNRYIALDKLLDLLWKNADFKIIENIDCLRIIGKDRKLPVERKILTLDGMINSLHKKNRQIIVNSPNFRHLKSEKIKQLYNGQPSVKEEIRGYIKNTILTKLQICRFIHTDDKHIIYLLYKLYEEQGKLCKNGKPINSYPKLRDRLRMYYLSHSL